MRKVDIGRAEHHTKSTFCEGELFDRRGSTQTTSTFYYKPYQIRKSYDPRTTISTATLNKTVPFNMSQTVTYTYNPDESMTSLVNQESSQSGSSKLNNDQYSGLYSKISPRRKRNDKNQQKLKNDSQVYPIKAPKNKNGQNPQYIAPSQRNKPSYNRKEQAKLNSNQIRIVELQQRLRALDNFYEKRIREEKMKFDQANINFVQVIEDLEQLHFYKVCNYRETLDKVISKNQSYDSLTNGVETALQEMRHLKKEVAQIRQANYLMKKSRETNAINIKQKQALKKELKRQLDQFRSERREIELSKVKQWSNKEQMLEFIQTTLTNANTSPYKK